MLVGLYAFLLYRDPVYTNSSGLNANDVVSYFYV